jgi:ADP-ribosylglycohydrolase
VPTRRERTLGGLWGAVVGDALGVPVEFQSRAELRVDPVTDLRAYGTYRQPRGTWSDDSSLLLCSAESLCEAGWDLADMGRRFVRWRNAELWTPHGAVFDIGATTHQAIANLAAGVPPEQAGLDDERSIGNGSLMRTLPVALRFADEPPAALLDRAHRASTLTHRHPRARMVCGLYCLLAAALLGGAAPREAYAAACAQGRAAYADPAWSAQLPHFACVLDGALASVPEDEISGSGYAVHCLEASVWCLLHADSYEAAVLRAVNLGEDTDTTATVAGGLAGLHWSIEAVPARWRTALARHDDLAALFDRFATMLGT